MSLPLEENRKDIKVAVAYFAGNFKEDSVEVQSSGRLKEQFEKLGQELGLELLELSNLNDNNIKQFDFLLLATDKALLLYETKSGYESIVDFSTILKSRLSKKLHLARAVSLKRSNYPTIIDATAGMGRDAYTLAALGCKVTMIEQSRYIAALLKDGLKRQTSIEPELIETMSLQQGNAMDIIPTLEAHDVIYLDPMFADRGKQALPKKEMQLFRNLIGHDDNVDELFEIALAHAKKRVVVKRHRTAKPLLDKKPSTELVGKQTRFDIYLR